MKMIENLTGKRILLTGSTGFVGRLTLSKLLRCTDVETVYLPIRGLAEERLQDLLADKSLFRQDDRRRLVPIPVDSSIGESLSLSAISPDMVDGTLHIAANTDWRKSFPELLKDNLFETEQLKDYWDHNFVYCSTAFCKPLVDGISLHEDVMELESIFQYFSGYAATKAICEKRMVDSGSKISVVRLGGVAGNMDPRDAPLGWSYGISAYNGLFLMNELSRACPPMIFPASPDNRSNIIPVNIAANSLIAALAERMEGPSRGNRFYNVIPSPEFNFTHRETIEVFEKDGFFVDNSGDLGVLLRDFMDQDLKTVQKVSKLFENLLTMGRCCFYNFDDIDFGNLEGLELEMNDDRFPLVYTGTVANLVGLSYSFFLENIYKVTAREVVS